MRILLTATAGLCLARWAYAAPVDEPFPTPRSIKGLQVQMVDDAITLGIHHAAINLALNGLATTSTPADQLTCENDGKSFVFSKQYVRSLDLQIKPLSDAGMVVYLIALAMPTGNADLDTLLLHPKASADRRFTVGAFNTETSEGRAWLRAAFEFLAQRYSGADAKHGRVWGWIIGNEVNSHHAWHNRGPSTLEEVTDGYEKAVRLAHDSLRKTSANGRVYLSFDHHWATSYTPDRPLDSVPARSLLDAFARLAKQRGDFDWNIAWHPYHSNLFATDLWNDPAAPHDDNAAKVTFRNLEVLCRYLAKPELKWQGKSRHLILSEQGFHSEPNPPAEQRQAAAYAYAWEKCRRLPQIDAFIYHRHVDHAHEGGLRLGLWRNLPGSIATPAERKPIYELFRKAGTNDWDAAVNALLPLTGFGSWEQAFAEQP
jgi:hypothetical protein